jgi:hypothetical protein
MFWRTWLSDVAKSEFVRALPWREGLARWIGQQKEALRTWHGFITIVFVIILLHIIVPILPAISSGLPTPSEIRSFVNTLWPVHAAIVSAIFIVVFFIIGTVHRERPLDVVLSNVVRKMYLVPVAAFALSSILGEGISSLLLLKGSVRGSFTFQGLENLLVLDFALFFLTMVALLYILWLTLKYVRFSEIWKLQVEIAQQLAKIAVEQQIVSGKASQVLRHEVEAAGLAWLGRPGNFEPVRTTKRGYVVDIDLGKVRQFGRGLSSKGEPTDMLGKPVYGSFSVNVGDKIDDANCIVAYVPPQTESTKLARVIEQALKVRSRAPLELDEFNQAFTDVLERALQATRGGERSVIKQTLGFYKQALLSFLNTTHHHGITHDYCTGSLEVEPPAHEWKVRERVLDDFEYLLFQSMTTDDATSYELMKHYPLEVMNIGMTHNDHLVFSQGIRYYAKAYSRIEITELAKGRRYWEDLSKVWAEHVERILNDMHYNARRVAGDPQKVVNIVRFAQLANRELLLFMMVAADRQDKDMCRTLLAVFSEMWNSFWDIRTGQFSEMERKAKSDYDKERVIGIVAASGMLALMQLTHGSWDSILGDCAEVLVQELEAMPDDFSFTAITNTGTELGIDRRHPQWFWDSLSFISIQSYEGPDGFPWLRFEDFVALGSVVGLCKLVEKEQLDEKEFTDSLNHQAIRPLVRALEHILAKADRWKDYSGNRGLETARATLAELQRRQIE